MDISTVEVNQGELIEAFRNAQGEVRTKAFFENGYGVSVIRSPYSYGGQEGFFELAVLKGTPESYKICYGTPITEDVEGWLTATEVADLTKEVSEL